MLVCQGPILPGSPTDEQVDRVEEFAILEQMAMSIPESRDDKAWRGCELRIIPGKHPREFSIFDRETLGTGLLVIMRPDALITICLWSVGAVREERLLKAHCRQRDDPSNS